MKAIIGAAIGVFAIGLVLVGATLRLSARAQGVPASLASFPNELATPQPRSGEGAPVADVATARGASGTVMVNCSPGQRAVVRPTVMNGETVSQVACVDDAYGLATVNGAGAVPAAPMPVAQPVSYRPASRAAFAERRVVYQEAALRPGSGQAPARVARSRSSWKKPLLVIGGSTAAGAGIGGLIGGKKGALIGAALGGGASTLWEATKR